MKYQLTDLETFIQVVEGGGITAAAQRLDLAKSVVSKRISSLEKALSVQLLNRSVKGTIPTERGQLFYRQTKDILQQLDMSGEALAEQASSLSGQLRISAPMSFGTLYLSPILCSFMQLYPQLELILELDDRKVDVEAEGYDLAVRITQITDSPLIAKAIARSERLICCSPAYAAEYGLPDKLEDIEQHKTICYSYVYSGHLWQFEPESAGGAFRNVVLRHPVFSSNNGEVMRDAAIAGGGLVLLPTFIAAKALAEGRLINAMPHCQPTADQIYLVYPHRRYPSQKVRLLVDYLAGYFSRGVPWESLAL